MANSRPNAKIQQATSQSTAWSKMLIEETPLIDQTGVLAGLVSIDLRGADERTSHQVAALVRHKLTRTDELHMSADGTPSLLLTPVLGLVDLHQRVHELHMHIDNAGYEATVGYALRRPAESLLDTWARAVAETDRAAFQAERGPKTLVLPD